MASVTYGKSIMSSVIMAKILWQMKLSPKKFSNGFDHYTTLLTFMIGNLMKLNSFNFPLFQPTVKRFVQGQSMICKVYSCEILLTNSLYDLFYRQGLWI